jgi:peroxiredoxin
VIRIGSPAPDFEALSTTGKRIRLSALRGRPVVLYFFPKAFTPGCTLEAREFRDAYPELLSAGAEVIGISTDDHQTQCSFAEKEKANFPMIGDPDGAIARQYDVVWPLLKLTKRVTFVIDPAGDVQAAFHFEMRVSQHVKSVLSALKASTSERGTVPGGT